MHLLDPPPARSRRSSAPHLSTARLAQHLDVEWSYLRTHRRSLEAARSWPLPNIDTSLAPTRELVDLEQLVQATHRRHGEPGNALLAALVRMSEHDELAGQVVLRRLLPGLLVGARRSSSDEGRDDGADQVIAAAWIAVRRYDVDRRPRHIAPSLISDAVYLAFRAPRRRRSLADAVDPAQFDWRSAEVTQHPFLELAGTLRLAADQRVAPEHLDLVRDLVRTESPSVLAAERGVTARTIRNHRERAITQIREAVIV